jgi:hypothetical protein
LSERIFRFTSAAALPSLNDRRLLLGAFEDIADHQAQWNFTQIVESVGRRRVGSADASVEDPARSDARRVEQGKAIAMTAAAQINQGDGRLLVEALSGDGASRRIGATSAECGTTWPTRSAWLLIGSHRAPRRQNHRRLCILSLV